MANITTTKNDIKATLVAVEQKSLNKITERLSNGNLILPQNYKFENAVTSAMLIIKQDEKLMNCDAVSIGESINKMVVLGLDPAQTQCYFVPYNGRCTLMTSYFGKQTILRRIPGVIDIVSQPIYENDEVDYSVEMGNIVNFKHSTKFGNRNNGIIGAYCIIKLDADKFGRETHIEIMTIDEIKKAWGQGAAKGNSPAHNNFPQEMAKKSVIARAAKNLINTMHEHDIDEVLSIYNETTSNEYNYVKDKNITADYEIKEQNLTLLEEQEVDPMANLSTEDFPVDPNQMDLFANTEL